MACRRSRCESPGWELSPHCRFKVGPAQTFRLTLFAEVGRRVVVGCRLVADVSIFPVITSQEGQKDFLGLLLSRRFVETGNPRLWQEQAALIAQHDGLAKRAVLVFLELKFAQIVSGCSPSLGFDALEVLPEPEGAVPGG